MPRMNSSSAHAPITNRASPANLKSRQSKRTPDGSRAVHSTNWSIAAVPTATAQADAPKNAPQAAPRRLGCISPSEAQVNAGWRATPVAVTASVATNSGIALRAMRLSVTTLSNPLAKNMAKNVATRVRLARSRSQSRSLRRSDSTGIQNPYFTVHAVPRLEQWKLPDRFASDLPVPVARALALTTTSMPLPARIKRAAPYGVDTC